MQVNIVVFAINISVQLTTKGDPSTSRLPGPADGSHSAAHRSDLQQIFQFSLQPKETRFKKAYG